MAEVTPVTEEPVAEVTQAPTEEPGPGGDVLVDVPTAGVHVHGDVLFVDGTAYSLLSAEFLGAGGLGIAYKVMPVDPDAGSPLVLKAPKMPQEAAGTFGGAAPDIEPLNAQAADEAKTAMALNQNDHPNLVKTHGIAQVTSPSAYEKLQSVAIKGSPNRDASIDTPNVIIMEYLGGGSVGKWLGSTGLLAQALNAGENVPGPPEPTPAETIPGAPELITGKKVLDPEPITYQEYVGVNQYIEYEIVKGLQHLHAMGFGHFDIKEENVVFDDDFNVKIIDLGGARAFDTTAAAPGTTKGWWPPEFAQQLRDKEGVTEAYDAYGMGKWADTSLEPVRGLKEEAHGPPAPDRVPPEQTPFASEKYVATGMANDPSQRSIAKLAEQAYLLDPIIDADRAREVLRFIKRWDKDRKLRREQPAPSPREEFGAPEPDAPNRKPLPFINELLAQMVENDQIKVQALVPRDHTPDESSEEAE